MNIVHRARQLMLTPDSEWDRIAAEPDSIGAIYRGYALPLAGIAVVASVIGFTVVGISTMGQTVRLPFFDTLLHSALGYGLGMASLYLMALLINAMAPKFGARQDLLSAFKVSAYSMTPSWLLGIGGLLPLLGTLASIIGGLWSLWLLHRGLSVLMRVPQERATGFTATLIAVLVGLSVVLVLVMRAFS